MITNQSEAVLPRKAWAANSSPAHRKAGFPDVKAQGRHGEGGSHTHTCRPCSSGRLLCSRSRHPVSCAVRLVSSITSSPSWGVVPSLT